MKKIFLPITIFLLLSGPSHGGLEPRAGGSRARAMGGSGLLLCDVWSVVNNPGAMAMADKNAVAVYAGNRFGLRELKEAQAAALLKKKKGCWGLHISSFGYSAYNEQSCALAYSKKLGGHFSSGVSLRYVGVNIQGYGSRHTLVAEAGFLAVITKQLSLAAGIYNPTCSRMAHDYDERIPTTAYTGISYSSGKFLICTVLNKGSGSPASLHTGMEYKPGDPFSARAGYVLNPGLFSFGFGFRVRKLLVDTGASFHPVLGLSSHIGLCFVY